MTEGAYTISVSTAGLAPGQREQLDAQIRSEGIPATWTADGIVVDQAFEARIEGLVATARSAAPAPSGFVATGQPPAPAPYAPQPYAPVYPAYGYQPQVTNSNATLSLVLAIVGWVACPIASIFGVIYGRRAQDEIAASGGTQSGEGLAKAGIIISWVVLAIYGLMLVGFVVFFILFGIIGIAASSA
jgi:hypothetical protein